MGGQSDSPSVEQARPFRTFVQAAVLRTNSIFPFHTLNKAPYWLAQTCFHRLCRTFPEITAVYVRNGITQAGWVPGISDIDVTVTFSEGLNAREEFAFLSRFSTRQASLRRVFPMLSDVLILNESHLSSSTQFGITGAEVSGWKRLFGPPPACAYGSADFARDALDDAVYRYFEYMLRWYSGPLSYVDRQRMRRVASRILRHAPQHLRDAANLASTDDPARSIARILLALDSWIAGLEPVHAGFHASQSGEDSLILRDPICLLVLRGGPDEESVRRSALGLRHQASGMRLRIVTRPLLSYWFRVWHPRQYADWMYDARVMNGPNVLSELASPTEEAFVRSLLRLTRLVLTLPAFEDVVLQTRSTWFAEEGFRWMVLRGWYLKLYLETGIHRSQHKEMMVEIERHDPEAVTELERIRQAALSADTPLEELRFRAFHLLRDTAERVNRALARAGSTPREARAVSAR